MTNYPQMSWTIWEQSCARRGISLRQHILLLPNGSFFCFVSSLYRLNTRTFPSVYTSTVFTYLQWTLCATLVRSVHNSME